MYTSPYMYLLLVNRFRHTRPLVSNTSVTNFTIVTTFVIVISMTHIVAIVHSDCY